MPEFFNVDGDIPVSFGLRPADVPPEFRPASGSVSASLAWDTDPPRSFDPGSASRNGVPMPSGKFWLFVSLVRARSKDAA